MPTFHRLIFWSHLIAGLLAGIVILSMSISGLLIAYEVQFMEWANRDLRVTPPSADAARLTADVLLARIRQTQPDFSPSGITWRAEPTAPVTLSVGREGTHFADPYTGVMLGQGNETWHDFFHAATDWHRFLTQTGLERPIGKAITGAGTLVFGILLLSGLYLWWPRHWRGSNLRAVLLFNRKLKGRARDWNWHNVIGFWSSFPMLLIILTGLIMSYSWANNLLFRLTGNEPPPPRTRTAPGMAGPSRPGAPNAGPREGGHREGAAVASLPDLSKLSPLLTEAEDRVPDWQLMSLRMPQKPGDPLPLMVDRGGRGQVHLRHMFQLDLASGILRDSPDDFQKQNLGRQLRMMARYLHTGELLGFIGQTIAALCTLAAALLTWTGFALAWRRFFPKNRVKATATS